ncbi:hypothetical protein EFQ99_19080 [Rhizobium vallis]|uniref:Uncharacterized protein n=1 Tax=Rhizobium vallis TaxID=634290 RepID=A0A3S0QP00_9HYPH|nr:hypothetical protein EFQ99_19080 [Rhizobium vallis]
MGAYGQVRGMVSGFLRAGDGASHMSDCSTCSTSADQPLLQEGLDFALRVLGERSTTRHQD